jgi:hypothetical protein
MVVVTVALVLAFRWLLESQASQIWVRAGSIFEERPRHPQLTTSLLKERRLMEELESFSHLVAILGRSCFLGDSRVEDLEDRRQRICSLDQWVMVTGNG